MEQAKDTAREESKREAIQSAAMQPKKEATAVTEVLDESMPAEFDEPAKAYGKVDDVVFAEVQEKEAKAEIEAEFEA